MEEKRIHVREVRLNGSAASYVLHEDSGLGWKDLDLIFCAELKGEMEFQIVKDIVLDSLLDFLPEGVNKEKITPMTLKVWTYNTSLKYFTTVFLAKQGLRFVLFKQNMPQTSIFPISRHKLCVHMHLNVNESFKIKRARAHPPSTFLHTVG